MSAAPSWRISVDCSVLNDDREVALRVACGCMNLGQNYAYPGRPNSSDPRESYPLLDHIFDELSRKLPGLSAEQLADNIVATAKRIQNTLLNSDQIHNAAPGLFILALQQVVDSFIAGVLTEKAFEWLAGIKSATGSDSN